jgi:hypothetical protein
MRIELSHEEALAIVNEIFPGLSDEDADDLLWSRTGWPVFFKTHQEASEIRDSLRRFKRTIDAGKVPCDDCDKVAAIIQKYGASCKTCYLIGGGQYFWWHRLKTILTWRKKLV